MAEPYDSVKNYIRVDTDDALVMKEITTLYNAAKALVMQKTGKAFEEESAEPKFELYRLAIWMMVSHWYENRTPVVMGTIATEIPYSAEMLINHISLCGDYA